MKNYIVVLIILASFILSCRDSAPFSEPALPVLSISDDHVIEGSNAEFVVYLDNISPDTVFFSYTLLSNTATDLDYNTTIKKLYIPAGRISITLVVATNEDNIAEKPETFFVTIENITGASAGTTRGTATIHDAADEGPSDNGQVISRIGPGHHPRAFKTG